MFGMNKNTNTPLLYLASRANRIMPFLFTIAYTVLTTTASAQQVKKYIKDGNDQYAQGNYAEAESYYSGAINKYRNSDQATFNLGTTYYKQEKFEEAAEEFRKVTNRSTSKDTLSKAYHNLGNALMKSEKYEDGVAAYKSALKNNPTDNDTRYNLAYAQQMLKKEQEQQQQDKDDKKDKKDDKEKKDDKDKKEGDNKDDKDKENEEKDKNKDDKKEDSKEKDDKKKEQQPKKDEISKEDAKRLLDALQNDEKNLQEKLKKQKGKGVKVNIEKDW